MSYTLKCLILFNFVFIIKQNVELSAEKITYISVEHPKVLGFNKKFLTYITLSSHRFGRRSPVYYVDITYHSLTPITNNYTLHFYFYEFLSNQYKRSFVEMHFGFCNLVHKDLFFGAAMKQGRLAGPCPYPPGDYNLANMTILPEAIPRGFPFTKGRIYCNITFAPTGEMWARGYVDMELRTMKVVSREKNTKL